MFSGCKEEETAPVEDVSVLGTWKLDSQSWKSCTKPESNLDEINMCSAATCMTYIFAPDGLFTYEIKINNITDVKNGTYSVARDQLTICITGCSIPVTVSRSGNDLTLNYADGATGCLVTRIYKS
jgi:hypothetical protein